MYRIDNSSAVPTLPVPGLPGTPGFFTDGNPAAALEATIVDAWWANIVQEEILTVVTHAGLTPRKDDHTQLFQALNRLYAGIGIGTGYLPLVGGVLANPGNLVVSGDLDVNRDIRSHRNLNADNDLDITRDAIVRRNLSVLAWGNFGDRVEVGDFWSNQNIEATYAIRAGTDIIATQDISAQRDGRIYGDLDVDHDIRSHGNLNVDHEFDCTGDARFYANIDQFGSGHARRPGGGAWDTNSDVRVKRDVAPYARGLAAICQLHPVAYSYNGLADTVDDGKVHHGLIAQEVLEVMPEMVFQEDIKLRDGDAEPTAVYLMNCTALTFALCNAVRELTARLEAVERKG